MIARIDSTHIESRNVGRVNFSLLPICKMGASFFDHNATAPLHQAARQAWLEAAEKFIANPASPHRVGGRAHATLEDARSRLAAMMGCSAHDIVWTSGATEANNQVLHHFAGTLPPEATVCISAIEHRTLNIQHSTLNIQRSTLNAQRSMEGVCIGPFPTAFGIGRRMLNVER